MNYKVKYERRKSASVFAGSMQIGGDAPVSVQSMTNTKTADIQATVQQILSLEEAGCEIVRAAVPNADSAKALKKIKKAINIPLVADIHFDYRLAVLSIENGADKIRINPGNIGSEDRVRIVLDAAKASDVPVRIGVNAGSLEKKLIQKYNGITAEGLVESALSHISFCEKQSFDQIILSIKASSVPLMIETNRMLAQKTGYPIHLGVTEAGTPEKGAIRSAVGIGVLLAEGIGDTIRVSLTGDPVREVYAAWEILKALGLRRRGLTVISCPTCARTHSNLAEIAEKVEKALEGIQKCVTVAIMGCEVNGPGEAREADIGVACGKKSALVFKKGEIIKTIKEEDIIETVIDLVKNFTV